MGETWQAPAKLNLGLVVKPPDRSGFHPIVSLVQTIELADILEGEAAETDLLVVDGRHATEDRENLVWKAVDELAAGRERPPIRWRLSKAIPTAAGLGGGSSDAAAALRATARLAGWDDDIFPAASRVGKDVPFFLVGGTAWMEGHGERVTSEEPLTGFAVAVVVPPFELATVEVYRRWDELGGPEGPGIDGRALPPSLRRFGPLRNDLTPAALSLRPELGDWIDELAGRWDRPVALTGSGPALFGYFADLDEAADAADSVPAGVRFAQAAALRPNGVSRIGEDDR